MYMYGGTDEQKDSRADDKWAGKIHVQMDGQMNGRMYMYGGRGRQTEVWMDRGRNGWRDEWSDGE